MGQNVLNYFIKVSPHTSRHLPVETAFVVAKARLADQSMAATRDIGERLPPLGLS